MGSSTSTTSPGLQKTLVATSWADCEPAVITTFSGLASRIPSAAMTSQIWVRSSSVPWPPPYCSAVMPCSAMIFAAVWPSRSSGRDCRYGLPPASETRPGRIEMSKTSRTADCLIFAARSENRSSWRWADVAARSIASIASAGSTSAAASSVSWVTSPRIQPLLPRGKPLFPRTSECVRTQDSPRGSA